MLIQDSKFFENKLQIEEFYKNSQKNEAMSAKDIRQWLEKYVSDKQNPVVIITNENISEDFPKGCTFECGSWRGSYNYPAAQLTDINCYSCETVVKNLTEMSGKEVVGYKGGNFVLNEEDEIFLVPNFSLVGNITAVVDITIINDVVYMATSDNLY